MKDNLSRSRAMDPVHQVTPPTPAAVKVLRPASDVPVLFGTLLVLEVLPGFLGGSFWAMLKAPQLQFVTGVALANARVVSSVDRCDESWDMCPC